MRSSVAQASLIRWPELRRGGRHPAAWPGQRLLHSPLPRRPRPAAGTGRASAEL